MKKIIALLLLPFMLLTCIGCSDDAFGHQTYTEPEHYHKIFELTEIRYSEDAFELFPETVDTLSVEDFYCEWELGIVGSAKAEISLSVTYSHADFKTELSRLKSLSDGKLIFDTENFNYDAYVSVLGYMNTSYYALIDNERSTIHYILLQLINTDDIDINKEFLPFGYSELGEVKDISYNIYE